MQKINKKNEVLLSKQINLMLDFAYHCEEPKLIMRWIKTFHSLFIKEIKKNKESRNEELMEKILSRLDILFQTLCGISEEEKEIFGPSIFETLLKIQEVYELLLAEEEENNSTPTFSVTEKQLESLLKVKKLSQKYG